MPQKPKSTARRPQARGGAKPAARPAAAKPAAKTRPAKSDKAKSGKAKIGAKKPGPALPERGVHDLGGLAAGAIDRSQHPLTPFEERVDALMMLLGGTHGIFKTDAVRRTIEAYNDEDYQHLTYYQKWLRALRVVLVEQSVLSDAEIEARIAALRDQGAAA